MVLMTLIACGSSDSDTPVTKKPDTEITTNNTIEPTPTAVAQKPTPTPKPTVSEKVLAIFSEKIYTLSDLEAIGFTKEFNTDYDYNGISESWDGTIQIDGQSQFLEVIIFDDIWTDEFEQEQLKMLGLMFDARTLVFNNLGLICHDEEVCNYVVEKLN